MARKQELREPQRHRNGGTGKSRPPAVPLREPGRRQRADQRSDVDAHVEESEACVTRGTAVRIQLRHHRADVRLQQADAEHDHQATEVEERGACRDRQQRVADEDQRGSPHDCTLSTEQAVGEPAAGQGHQVRRRGVEAVDRGGLAIVEPEAAGRDGIDQEQDQDPAHPVIGEALPHLRHEERGESPRMPEPVILDGESPWRKQVSVPCSHARPDYCLYTVPCFMTNSTLSIAWMSSSGSRVTATMSAE